MGEISQKTNKEEGLHKKRRLEVCRFKGGLSRKRGWQFLKGGEGLIPHRILCFLNKLKGKGRPFLEGPKKGAFERALVRIRQILHVILESTSQFAFKFYINL